MRKLHILVVDDDPIARAGIGFMLENAGYEVSEAFNGKTALESIENDKTQKINAIILDRMMPEMSGIEMLKKIHAMPSLSNIPLIMLTAQAERDHIKTATDYGVAEVIYKPIEEATFLLAIEKALKQI